MFRRFLHRMVMDVRFGRIRLVPLIPCAGYLFLRVLFAGSGDKGYVVLLLLGVVLLFAGGRWPLPVALGESVLLVVGAVTSESGPGPMVVLASVALLELAFRRPLRQAVFAAVVLGLIYGSAKGAPTAVGVFVVIPLLLGAWLRLVALRVKDRRLRDLRTAQQAERTEIAREVHDLVAHHVASIGLRVGVARAVVPDLDPRVGEVLDDVHRSAFTALADLRRLVGMLRDPSVAGDGLRLVHVDPADLPAVVMEVIDRAGPLAEGHVDPAIAGLDTVRGLAVLRLVQEGLTNVAKHAEGAHATVRVDVREDDVRVEVTDDGGVPHPPTEPGYGLIGLRERVAVIGGTITAGAWGAGTRRGWRLLAILPTTDRCEHGVVR